MKCSALLCVMAVSDNMVFEHLSSSSHYYKLGQASTSTKWRVPRSAIAFSGKACQIWKVRYLNDFSTKPIQLLSRACCCIQAAVGDAAEQGNLACCMRSSSELTARLVPQQFLRMCSEYGRCTGHAAFNVLSFCWWKGRTVCQIEQGTAEGRHDGKIASLFQDSCEPRPASAMLFKTHGCSLRLCQGDG